MKQFMKYIQFIVSTVAITLSIIAICVSYPRSADSNLDYLAIIVGVLAILVAILIGWQLFNALNLKEIVNQAERAKQDSIGSRTQAEHLLSSIQNLSEDLKAKIDKATTENTANTKDINSIGKRIKQLHEFIHKVDVNSQLLHSYLDSLRNEINDKISKAEVKEATDDDMRSMILRVLGITENEWNKIKK